MDWMRDPTAEASPLKRPRRAPLPSLEDKAIALFDIGKTRSDEFLDRIELRLKERGLATKRFSKPTNSKVASPDIVRRVAAQADAVLIALSD